MCCQKAIWLKTVNIRAIWRSRFNFVSLYTNWSYHLNEMRMNRLNRLKYEMKMNELNDSVMVIGALVMGEWGVDYHGKTL